MQVPQQTNGYDCGPFTLRNASTIIMMDPTELHEAVKQNAILDYKVAGSLNNPREYLHNIVKEKYEKFLNKSSYSNRRLL